MVGVFGLLLEGKLPRQGFIGQEQVRLAEFLGTRVGHYYRLIDRNSRRPSCALQRPAPHQTEAIAA